MYMPDLEVWILIFLVEIDHMVFSFLRNLKVTSTRTKVGDSIF